MRYVSEGSFLIIAVRTLSATPTIGATPAAFRITSLRASPDVDAAPISTSPELRSGAVKERGGVAERRVLKSSSNTELPTVALGSRNRHGEAVA